MNENATVYIVDDDQAVRDVIMGLVVDMGLKAKPYCTAEDFLASYKSTGPDCLVLDVRMPGMSGVDLLAKLSEDKNPIPVLLISGHGDIQMAVKALKNGAVDFIEKPFREQSLWEKIQKALQISTDLNHSKIEREKMNKKIALLTEKERQVLKRLLNGETDKQIANGMGFTRRTAAFHRSNIFEKLETGNIIELVKSFNRFGLSL